MEKITVDYQVTVGDFRQATYYGTFLRHRKALRIAFAVLLMGILYGIGAAIGLGEINPWVLFLAAGYLIWALVFLSGVEKGIKAYIKSPGCMIGTTFHAEIDDKTFRIEIPERGTAFSSPLRKLTCVFEISSLYMFYTSVQDVYILPARCLTPEQRTALRPVLRNKLGANFGSRFK